MSAVRSGARQCECEHAEGWREGRDNKPLVVLIWRVLEYYIGDFIFGFTLEVRWGRRWRISEHSATAVRAHR